MPPHGSKDFAQVRVQASRLGSERYPACKIVRRLLNSSLLKREYAEALECCEVIRLFGQEFSIENLSLGCSPLVVEDLWPRQLRSSNAIRGSSGPR